MTEEKPKNIRLSTPPKEVFLMKRIEDEDEQTHISRQNPLLVPAAQHERVPVLDPSKGINGVTYPKEGGQYIWHVGRKYPRKGHVYPEALQDLFWPKRIMINAIGFFAKKRMIPFFILFGIMPKKIRGKILDKLIASYIDTVDSVLIFHYLQPRFHIDICREIGPIVARFLMELGVSVAASHRFALICMTILEYDSAYRLRLEDLLTETTKEKMLADPVGEAQRLIKILGERDDRKHLIKKFDGFAKLMKYGFFFIRKPFRKALKPTNFEKLQFDEIDRYMVQHWMTYNFFGMTIEERVEKWPAEDYPAFELKKIN